MAKPIHWTEKSIDDFVNWLSFDFVTQIVKKMEALPLKQAELAKKLDLSEGRVSQILNNPGNLTLKQIIKYARVLGMKVAVVAYDDNDPSNERGPVNSEIFSICWEQAGRPHDFFSIPHFNQSSRIVANTVGNVGYLGKHSLTFAEKYGGSNTDVKFPGYYLSPDTIATPGTIQQQDELGVQNA